MNRLILSAAASALMLGACATTAAQERPPHLPADLSPGSVAAADEFIWRWKRFRASGPWRSWSSPTHGPWSRWRATPATRPSAARPTPSCRPRTAFPRPASWASGLGNFWQDDQHPKGIWRRTTLDSYRSGNTRWETILDIDALARAEGRTGSGRAPTAWRPTRRYCLVNLSDGGQGRGRGARVRHPTGRFVEGGFRLPEGKHRVTWLDARHPAGGHRLRRGHPDRERLSLHRRALTRGQTLDQATRDLSRRAGRRRLWRQPLGLSRAGRRGGGGDHHPAAGHLPLRDAGSVVDGQRRSG